MLYKIPLKDKYLNLIKQGRKTIELRLYTKFFQQIKIGDKIEFFSMKSTLVVSINGLIISDSFKALFDIIKPQDAGFTTIDEALSVMQKVYPTERQLQNGVIGIKIKNDESNNKR